MRRGESAYGACKEVTVDLVRADCTVGDEKETKSQIKCDRGLKGRKGRMVVPKGCGERGRKEHIDTRRRSYLFQLTSYISFPSTKSHPPRARSSACPQSGTLKLNRSSPRHSKWKTRRKCRFHGTSEIRGHYVNKAREKENDNAFLRRSIL